MGRSTLGELVPNPIEAAVPGGAALHIAQVVGGGILRSVYRHPLVVAPALLAAGAVGIGLSGYAEGFAIPEVTIEQKVEAVYLGRADVIAIDLEIENRPLVGYTAEVTGSITKLNAEAAIKAGWIDEQRTIQLAEMKWNGIVDVLINYDPSKMEIFYDQGMIADPADDKMILKVPLDAISTTASLQPLSANWDINENMLSLPANITSAWADSWSLIEKVPGLGQMAAANHTSEQTLAGFSAINALNNVEETCTPEVVKNVSVYTVLHNRMAEDLGNAVLNADSGTPLDGLTVDQLRNMTRIVYIGDEDATSPVNLAQSMNFDSQYGDLISDIESGSNVDLSMADDAFKCSISDEVKAELAEDTQIEPGQTLRSRGGN